MNIEYVSRKRLRGLFHQHGVWEGLRQGLYTHEQADKAVIPVRAGSEPPGGTQIYVKWLDIFGRHVVTTHMVVDADGWPVHWDEKDLILGLEKYVHLPELD